MSDVAIELSEHPDGVILPVKAQPGARRSGLAGIHGGMLKVQVTQAPEKGKATEAVLDVVAEALQLKRSQVTLLSGATSPQKRLLVTGISQADFTARINAVLSR